jgi:hypothetical protein
LGFNRIASVAAMQELAAISQLGEGILRQTKPVSILIRSLTVSIVSQHAL